MPEVVITDSNDTPLRPPGLKALRREREARESAERDLLALEPRIQALERRKPANTAEMLAGLAGIRGDLMAEQASIRRELHELAEGLEQLRAILQQQG